MAKKIKEVEGKHYEIFYFTVQGNLIKVYAYNEDDATNIIQDKFKGSKPELVAYIGELIQDSDGNYRVNIKS